MKLLPVIVLGVGGLACMPAYAETVEVLAPTCWSKDQIAVQPSKYHNYWADYAASLRTIQMDGSHDKTNREFLFWERLTFDVGIKKSGEFISETGQRYKWDEKPSVGLVFEIPLNLKHEWIRYQSAARAAEEENVVAMEQAKAAFFIKLLDFKKELAGNGPSLNAQKLALEIAAKSPTFADACLTEDWRVLLQRSRP